MQQQFHDIPQAEPSNTSKRSAMSRRELVAGSEAVHVAEWRGIRVERHRRASALHSIRYGGDDVAAVIVSLSNTQRVERVVNGRRQQGIAYRGTATIVDPQCDTLFHIDGQTDIVKFFLPVADLRPYCGGSVPTPLTERHHELERLAYRVAHALARGEGADDFVMAELLSTLATSVAAQPLQASFRGGLAPGALRRVTDLIENGLEQPRAVSPSLQSMAAEAHLSVYHFTREFGRSVGMTPHQFALRRRLERARDQVIVSGASIRAVSERYGFASPSHFVQRFHAEFRLPPAKLRALIAY